MDIKIEKGTFESRNYFESYSRDALEKFLTQYDFIKSVNVFFRGKKHPSKKVKLKARFKGKEIFVEASAAKYPAAIDLAVNKLKSQIEKYKTRHYKKPRMRFEPVIATTEIDYDDF